MATKTLNDPYIKNYPAPDKRTEIYDDVVSGFALRVTQTGYKSFVYRYRFKDKVKRYTIGSYSKIGLADARAEARKLAYEISQGIDPLAEKKKAQNRPDPKTFNELAKEFKDKYLPTLRESTQSEYERIVDNELIPALGDVAIKDITKNQIIDILDKKAYKDDSPTMANRIRARLSKIFNFGIDRGLAESNPVSKTSKYKDGENKRSRYYSDDEIRKLWKAFENQNEPAQSILKMLLLTGQRKGETSRMKWDDIRDGVWTIPAEDAKGKRPHDVPLSSLAQNLIKQIKPRTGKSKYVFESPVNKGEPVQDIKRAAENVRDESKVKDFRPHDLRRTVTTNMAKLKIDRTVLGKVLNHKRISGDDQVTAIYDRHNYLDEKREALDKWACKLNNILKEKEEEDKD